VALLPVSPVSHACAAMSKVFVSSTGEDLASYRVAVCEALRRAGHEVVEAANHVWPMAGPAGAVVGGDVFIGILAWHRGRLREDQGPSRTDLEYQRARDAGVRCVIFYLDPIPPRATRLSRARGRASAVGFHQRREELAASAVRAVSAAADPRPTEPMVQSARASGDRTVAARVWALIGHNPLVAAFIAGLAVAVIAAYVLTRPEDPEGRICAPRSGQVVSRSFTVDGSLYAIPDDRHVWVAVQIGNQVTPKEPEIPSQDRRWVQDVVEAGRPPDGRFTLALLMVDEQGHREILRWVRAGHEARRFPSFEQIPGSVKLDVVRDIVLQ
jgi:hypothetical protein